MRTAFIQALQGLASADRRINLVVGDLGFGVVTDFAAHFPDQFLNVGVAEQNMIGVATGLALSGRTVFTYSIANFATLRCLEQIRNDVCYHNADVKIVSVGGGVAYGAVGPTHHATEDLAIMRALPNMTVVAPGDPVEAGLATQAVAAQPGPCYLRLGRAGEPEVHGPGLGFELGRALRVRDGRDVALIATGGMLFNTMEAAQELSRFGIEAQVLSMHTLKPLDTEAVVAASQETGVIVTIEEHSIIGGLSGAVLEALADAGVAGVRCKRIGLPSRFSSEVGSQEYLLDLYGLSASGIARAVGRFLRDL